MKKYLLIGSLLLASIFVQANDNMLLTCPIKKQCVCSFKHCNMMRSSVIIKLRVANGKAEYSRCNKKSCDKYRASITRSGGYILISASSKNSLIKIDSKDMSFVESASLGLVAYIGFGVCRNISGAAQ